MKMKWDKFIEKHFQEWLYRTVHADERRKVYDSIFKLVEHDPSLLSHCSWPEMRRMAEGSFDTDTLYNKSDI